MNEKTNPPDPRNSLMAALSAVEQVVAVLPVAPPIVTLNRFESFQPTYSVDLYFRYGAEGVAEFADAFGVELTERETAKGEAHVEAHVRVFGHDVRAWWLGDAPTLASVPVAWSAAAVSA